MPSDPYQDAYDAACERADEAEAALIESGDREILGFRAVVGGEVITLAPSDVEIVLRRAAGSPAGSA